MDVRWPADGAPGRRRCSFSSSSCPREPRTATAQLGGEGTAVYSHRRRACCSIRSLYDRARSVYQEEELVEVGCAMRFAYKVPGFICATSTRSPYAAMRNAFMLIVGFPPSATTSTTVNRKADISSLSDS